VRRLAIASAVLLAGSAHAVDYQKCEAIQQVYSRVKQQQELAGKSAYKAKLSQLCAYPEAETTAKDGGKALAAYYNCQTEIVNYRAAVAASSEAESSYQVKIEKIKSDIKKADCP